MKTVGILTMHKVSNFGSALQAYATQKVIASLGYDSELIDYIYPNEFQYSRGYSRPIKNLKSRISFWLGLHPRWKKMKAIKSFWPYLKVSKTYKSYEDIHKNPPIYDIYVTGSDQVWNSNFTKGDTTFFLDFAPKDAKRISYASSFSNASLYTEFVDKIGPLLKAYKFISVREKKGAEIVDKLIGKNVPVTLDPTLLLDSAEWNRLADAKKDKYFEKKYILLYVLAYALNPIPYIYDVAIKLHKQTGLEIIALGEVDEKYFGRIPIMKVWDADPITYLHLIRNAAYVVTSSFHGVAFSVNYGKPLVAVIDKSKKDDRITTLLSRIGLEKCIYDINGPSDVKNVSYQVDLEQDKLKELRQESLKYLKMSLM